MRPKTDYVILEHWRFGPLVRRSLHHHTGWTREELWLGGVRIGWTEFGLARRLKEGTRWVRDVTPVLLGRDRDANIW